MFYKGIIIDLDNTIYNYDKCHKAALNNVVDYIKTIYKGEYIIREIYDNISKELKYELINTASCHNKSIYFKKLLENLELDLSILDLLIDLYWRIFFENMVCYDGVKEFLIWNKKNGVKIGILTDYETEYQIKKLSTLNILNYIDVIVTSEEVGIEKPSCQMFQTILRRLSLNTNEVIVIGDNFEKDIIGAFNMNIFAYWFNTKTDTSNLCIKRDKHYIDNGKYIEFGSFNILLSEFTSIHTNLSQLKEISRYCGERFDLVQAGGGNSSVKTENNWMFIKASGINMSTINEVSGYVSIDNSKLLHDINADNVGEVLTYNIIGNKRGSIETFMHSILNKYTIHLHPIQVNRILVTKDAIKIANELFPTALIIDYFTPGIKVCNEIRRLYTNENIIFLINHGLIITCDTYEEVYKLLDVVIEKFEKYQNINCDKYKFTNVISKFINVNYNLTNVSYLCENYMIIEYFNSKKCLFCERIAFPDALIYCGLENAFIDEVENIKTYYDKFKESPKIIIIDNRIYLNSTSISKCKEIEELMLANLIILDSIFDKNYLSIEEICFLNNWDAEKYRRLI
jgi:HAD superfamily hydrolase (TIGR01549 family)